MSNQSNIRSTKRGPRTKYTCTRGVESSQVLAVSYFVIQSMTNGAITTKILPEKEIVKYY